jgi:putative FmdB family regulatory protein
MPIYEYRCPNGHVFELFQKIGDAPPEKCEVCGEGPLERVLYPVAVHFKGSGFYNTDYGKKQTGAASEGKAESSSDSSKKSDSGSGSSDSSSSSSKDSSSKPASKPAGSGTG